jgi:hypothetical protein
MKSRTNPTTGRLGCIHVGLLETGQRLPAIPQPEGWGSFTLAYNTDGLGLLAQFLKRQPGIHASPHKAAWSIRDASLRSRAVGLNEISPTSRLGDCKEAAAPLPLGRRESTPTFRLGDSCAFFTISDLGMRKNLTRSRDFASPSTSTEALIYFPGIDLTPSQSFDLRTSFAF